MDKKITREKGKRLTDYVSDYVVFDLETTGLSPATDEIIEISGIKVREHKVVDTFSTLVNPCTPIPYGATRVNGITNAMVKDAPLLKEALGNFLTFIGEDILVGHNIHTFDTNFIYDGAIREFGRKVTNDYVDTLHLAKACLPQMKTHKLTDIAAHFAIATEGAHRALNDCVMNQKCYEKLGEIWKSKEAARVVQTVGRGAAGVAGQQSLAGIQTATGAQGLVDVQAADGLCNAAGEQGAVSMQATGGEPICPECGCVMVKRKGRFGEFYGCTGFPLCRHTRKV